MGISWNNRPRQTVTDPAALDPQSKMANPWQNKTFKTSPSRAAGHRQPPIETQTTSSIPQRPVWSGTAQPRNAYNLTAPSFRPFPAIPTLANLAATAPANVALRRNNFAHGSNARAHTTSQGPPPVSTALRMRSSTSPCANAKHYVLTQTANTRGTIPTAPRALFTPSSMADPLTRARREHPTAQEIARRVAAGVSPNYQGDYRLARNRPANIPPEQNCSVWVTGLPPNITVHELLRAIRDTGRVWATVIQPPSVPHGTSAAKITFFTAVAAQIFLSRANGPGQPGLLIDGYRACVRPDRNRVAEAQEPTECTRVISVAGPKEIVTEEYLREYFSARFVYETDEVVTLVQGKVINVLEWYFGSYRCQAQWAWRNIREDAFLRNQGVRVKYERDPCDW